MPFDPESTSMSWWQGQLQYSQARLCAEICTRRIREEGREDLREGVERLFKMTSDYLWRDKPHATEFGPPNPDSWKEPDAEKISVVIIPRKLRDAVYSVFFEVLSIDVNVSRDPYSKSMFIGRDCDYCEGDLQDLGFDFGDKHPSGHLFEMPEKTKKDLLDPFLIEMWQYLRKDKELPEERLDRSR